MPSLKVLWHVAASQDRSSEEFEGLREIDLSFLGVEELIPFKY